MSSRVQSLVNSLLGVATELDPVLLTILQEMLDELDRIGTIVDPAPSVISKISSGAKVAPGIVISFTYELTKKSVILRWTPGTFDFQFYELRKGTEWNTASRLLVTNNIEVHLDPISVGEHTYLLKTIAVDGTYSDGTASVNFIIPVIGPLDITAEVAVNNVLLRWTSPISIFEIDYYVIQKEGIEIARQKGTFFSYAEGLAGSYRYTVVSVDLAGNIGPDSSIVVDVSGFPDFVLHGSLQSDFSGTKFNARIDVYGRLIVAVNTIETIQEHFDTRSWDSPQEQIDAGYPMWITPVPTTAYYEEVFDFGLIFTNVIVSLSWMFEVLGGSFTFGIDARVSDDGITYSSPYTIQTFYVASARYIKVKMSFTSSNDKALMAFSNFVVALSIKREQDAGVATADASDTDGTVVTFNKAFKDIEGITIAPMSTTTVIPIVEFLDVSNPTFFKVKIYDNAGIRKTVVFRWDARGVM